ncbi:MAG: phenylalanine--tRNA ligase subunit alpha [Spirochaetaceae bacterium]|jgi:phenylalanyl-tRNA synthetase alpha chain|nr:phenylalanine--tRNA ligase subunit alpha [Spirochaetaceae bacterium]
MDIQNTIKNLHPLEVKVILRYGKDDELSVERIEADLGFKSGNQVLSWLLAKGLISEKRRETAVFYEITELGRSWKANGTPEERMLELVRIKPGLTLPEIAETLGVDGKDVGSAFGLLAKLGLFAMNDAKQVGISLPPESLKDGRPASGPAADHFAVVRALLTKGADAEDRLLPESALNNAEREAAAGMAKKRAASLSAFRMTERETVFFSFGEEHAQLAAALKRAGLSGEEIGVLTPQMLESGAWKGKTFRVYNVQVPPARLLTGRTNAYSQFLEQTKDKLVSLGFEEFDGPLVETEFWNSDALFMPQFHSARDIHDVYHIAEPASAKKIDEPWLSAVSAAHENGGDTGSRGWGYTFDREFTKRLILRSQGTVMSAKTLPHAKIPGKYFGMLRCFRYDKVDATHLSDFYQTEGIVLGEDVNLRTLLGMLEMFATEVAGAKEVKYVPGYFPFTEPSVEVHIKHPVLGWFELGGSGIFRPEVTASLGVKVPVAAWGIGIDRMALMALGLSDLRELFSYDIESVRMRRHTV